MAQVLKDKQRKLLDTNSSEDTNDLSINYTENVVFDLAQNQSN